MCVPFRSRRRVEFGDTDMAGIAHFSNFCRYMESAETDFLHSKGLSVSWVEGGQKFGFPRVSVACDFQRPVRFEDVLDIDVIVEEIGQKSVRYRFDFSRAGESVAVGRITAVYCQSTVDRGLVSMPIPDRVRGLLAEGQAST